MNLIKSHKIVTVTLLIGVIGSAVGITVINQPVDNQVRHVPELVAEPRKTVKDTPPVTAPEPVLEDPAPEVVDVPVVEVEAVAEPAVEEVINPYAEDTSTHYAFEERVKYGKMAGAWGHPYTWAYVARNLGIEVSSTPINGSTVIISIGNNATYDIGIVETTNGESFTYRTMQNEVVTTKNASIKENSTLFTYQFIN